MADDRKGIHFMPLQQGTDPRVIRTRLLIQEAFMALAEQKEFEAISVKDIAEKASINRATFYAHYVDKFALLDDMLTERFALLASERIPPGQSFNEDSARQLIALLCEFQILFYKQCKIDTRSIAAVVEDKVKKQLHEMLLQMLQKQAASADIGEIEPAAHMIGSSIYSATRYWYNNQHSSNADKQIEDMLVFVMSGTNSLGLLPSHPFPVLS